MWPILYPTTARLTPIGVAIIASARALYENNLDNHPALWCAGTGPDAQLRARLRGHLRIFRRLYPPNRGSYERRDGTVAERRRCDEGQGRDDSGKRAEQQRVYCDCDEAYRCRQYRSVSSYRRASCFAPGDGCKHGRATSTIKQNADNARQTSGLAYSATDVAHQGSDVVKQVVGTTAGIDESSRKIADIMGNIERIA